MITVGASVRDLKKSIAHTRCSKKLVFRADEIRLRQESVFRRTDLQIQQQKEVMMEVAAGVESEIDFDFR